jgi:hypothetical protein
VSKAETLSRLERLLERVRARAGARGGARAAPAPAIAAAAAGAELIEEPVQLTTWTPPPPEAAVPDVAIAIDVDYVEAAQVTVADGGPEEVPSERFDSAERLVVAGAIPTDEAGDELIPEPEPGDELGAPGETQLAADALGEETAEPAPISSRRPVMGEPDDRLERMAFGADEAPPPLHTPPPESGRVPAAPADDFDSEVGDARESDRPDEPLVAEPRRAHLESGAPVIKLSGTPRRSMPATFSALLDETLSL